MWNAGEPMNVRVLVLLGLAGAACALLARGLAEPTSTLLGPAVVRVPEPKALVLTFDDGPSEPYTAQVLDILKAYGVPAAFFVCGAQVERHPELMRRIVAEGHAIGNHTYSHTGLHFMSAARIAAEIDRTQDAVERVTGRRMRLFRPPFGVRWFPLWGLLKERGLTMVQWSIRGYDGRYDAAGIERAVLNHLEPGGIVLLHDGVGAHPGSAPDRVAMVQALPRIIEGARKAGYAFASLPD